MYDQLHSYLYNNNPEISDVLTNDLFHKITFYSLTT